MSKGKKPDKPISKKTAILLKELARRRGGRTLPQRILIVCEDDKSAPHYFEALKKHFNLSAASVVVVGSGGSTQPIQVVQQAIELKNRAAESNSGTEPFGQVWCVIDGDYGNKINNARGAAQDHSIELAISTKCFEYWVLLHFEENDKSTLDCDGFVRLLRKKHIPKYQKGACDFSPIVTNVSNACKRAEKLRQPGIDRGDQPEDQNPCSEVYKLVNAMLPHE